MSRRSILLLAQKNLNDLNKNGNFSSFIWISYIANSVLDDIYFILKNLDKNSTMP